jgi:hypothetical protein
MLFDLTQVFDSIPVIIQWAAELITAFLFIVIVEVGLSLVADSIRRKGRKYKF